GEMVRTVRPVRPMVSKDCRRVTYCRQWKGTAADLLRDLSSVVDQPLISSRAWPKNPRDLGCRLRRITDLLSTKGVEIDFRGPEGHANIKMIYITVKIEVIRETQVAPIAPLANRARTECSTDDDFPPAEEDEVYDTDEASP